MVLAELKNLERPVAASDPGLLQRLGVTHEAHHQVLKQLEQAWWRASPSRASAAGRASSTACVTCSTTMTDASRLSAEILRRLDEERAFWRRGRFHEFALDYVPWDDLRALRPSTDGSIARCGARQVGVPVIGPSGSGKSVVIAAAAQRLSDAFTCLRIPVAAVGDVAGSPVALGQHILREAVQQAELALAAHQSRSLIEAAADRPTRRHRRKASAEGSGWAFRASRPRSPATSNSLALDHEQLINATGVVQGLDRLVSVFTARADASQGPAPTNGTRRPRPRREAQPASSARRMFSRPPLATFEASELTLSTCLRSSERIRPMLGLASARSIAALAATNGAAMLVPDASR